MDSSQESAEENDPRCPFNDVPNEVLEFILSFLPPYKDLENCILVCKRWSACATNVLRKTEHNLHKAINEFNINWKTITPDETSPSITKRFSHAACVYNNYMYIFGGYTINFTSFNDLWCFDLSKRQWVRPMTYGNYPTPKAYPTMVPYKNYLILFGGWTYTTSIACYGSLNMTSETHFYDTETNYWIQKNTTNSPPPLAGHSATIKNDNLIIFGGLNNDYTFQTRMPDHCDVWVLNLKTLAWTSQPTSSPRPASRHGQSLIELDDDHVMIIGGVKGKIFNDCWVLRMTGDVWTWFEITVKNNEWSNTKLWCNPACKVGDKVVTLSYEENGPVCPISATRITNSPRSEENSTTHRLERNMRRLVDRDNNVNGKRGVFPHRRDNPVGSNKSNEAMPNMLDEEPKAGPSSAHTSSINNVNKLTSENENVNRINLNRDTTSSIKKEINSKGLVLDVKNRHVQQNPNNLGNGQVIRGKRSLSNGVKTVFIREADVRMAAFACESAFYSPSPNNIFNRQVIKIQHELEKFKSNVLDLKTPAVKKIRRNTMTMRVLDISSILNKDMYSSVSWMRPQFEEVDGAPEKILMYSLVLGNGELLMFGGFHCNGDLSLNASIQSSGTNFISNSLYFLIPPKNII